MLRWLLRLLVLGLIFFAVTRIVSRLLNQDEDFDDYDDIEAGFEFTETPVEIDVSVESPVVMSTSMAANATESSVSEDMHSLIDINGIGPTYATRLNEVGISTLEDLANANPDDLAERVNVIGGRAAIQDWIDQARASISDGA